MSTVATTIPVEGGRVAADVVEPAPDRGVVLFAHGSGSSRASTRNGQVAAALQGAGIGTVLFDLLTPGEMLHDRVTHGHRFDIPLLAGRVSDAVAWVRDGGMVAGRIHGVGVFGASTGAAAALIAAAAHPDCVGAVVCRGGRADLAADVLPLVMAPVLFICGGDDRAIVDISSAAAPRLRGPAEVIVIPGATHLFEEPGAIDEVSALARDWFLKYL